MATTLLSGVVSGLIASIVFFFLFYIIKPKIIISDKICRDASNCISRIKVVNMSRYALVNVKYTLYLYRRSADGIADVSFIKPNKKELEFIKAYSKTESDYAVRLSYRLDEVEFNSRPNEESYLLFSIYACHSLTGSSIFLEKKYDIEDIQCGQFETGKSTIILVESCRTNSDDPQKCLSQSPNCCRIS